MAIDGSREINGFDWKVSEDRLFVYIQIEPHGTESTRGGGNPSLSPDDVREILRANNILAEIDEETLAAEITHPSGDWVVVAQGKPPKPPVDAYLEYIVDLNFFNKLLSDDSTGKVDHKKLNLILNVEKGQELVRKHDPIPGEPGVDVFGKEIPPDEPRDITIPTGEGVVVIENGHLAVATRDGAVTAKHPKKFESRRAGERVDVFEDESEEEFLPSDPMKTLRELKVTNVYRVTGDVSYKTGNIDFKGSVEVSGSVLSGFRVMAENDIIIHGVVEGAELEAGGSITIAGGIQGGGKAVLRAGEGIFARFANEATLIADGDVRTRVHLINCEVFAGESVVVESPKGVISGGYVRARDRIVAGFCGTDLGVKTVLQMGLVDDISKQILELEEQITQITNELTQVQQVLIELNENKGDKNSLSPEEETLRIEKVREQFKLMGNLEALQVELESVKKERELCREGTITADDTAYSGAVIRFPGAVEVLKRNLRHVCFYYEDGEIHTRAV